MCLNSLEQHFNIGEKLSLGAGSLATFVLLLYELQEAVLTQNYTSC